MRVDPGAAAAMVPGAWAVLAIGLCQSGSLDEARKTNDFAIDLDSLNSYIRGNFERSFEL